MLVRKKHGIKKIRKIKKTNVIAKPQTFYFEKYRIVYQVCPLLLLLYVCCGLILNTTYLIARENTAVYIAPSLLLVKLSREGVQIRQWQSPRQFVDVTGSPLFAFVDCRTTWKLLFISLANNIL